MQSKNFTRVAIATKDVPDFIALKNALTIKQGGVNMPAAGVIRWLLDQPESQRVLREGKQ